ncbi:hypothetical protein V8E54_004257 [Elaphomyces granulatus]
MLFDQEIRPFKCNTPGTPIAIPDLCSQVNADQRHAFERIIPTVLDASPDRHFFLQGAGRTGKTFLYRAISAPSVSLSSASLLPGALFEARGTVTIEDDRPVLTADLIRVQHGDPDSED